MTDEYLLPDPPPDVRVEHQPAEELVPAPEASLPPPTAEQVRAADGVFAESKEADTVLGLLGMWTGTLLLHDLAREHLQPPRDQVPPRLRKDDEDDEPAP